MLKLLTLTISVFLSLGQTTANAVKNDDTVRAQYTRARQVVFLVFPADRRDLMLKVAGCETGGKYNANAYNHSGASGYFQILSSHDGETYAYNGISITVSRSRLFEPMYNALVAYCMSNGGTSLSAWYSSKGCWD